jgi:hypothetical protein
MKIVWNIHVVCSGVLAVFLNKQDRKCTYICKIGTRRRNIFCCGKAIIITYSECVLVALLIQYAKRVRRIILSYVTSPAVPYISPLPLKQKDFPRGGDIIDHKICFGYL